jgi:hypothetical protein
MKNHDKMMKLKQLKGGHTKLTFFKNNNNNNFKSIIIKMLKNHGS